MDGDLDLFLTGLILRVQKHCYTNGNTKQKNTAPAQITGLIATDLGTENAFQLGCPKDDFSSSLVMSFD
jgi:hypothetical protein